MNLNLMLNIKFCIYQKKNEITKGAQLNRNFGSKVVRFFATLKKLFSGNAKKPPVTLYFSIV